MNDVIATDKFAALRSSMIEQQLKARGIHDPQVINAMARIPREDFVPLQYRDEAYHDGPVPIEEHQTISQPYIVALMTQCLCLSEHNKVLEVGTGSGYQTAVLLQITPHVYSIERIASLAQRAHKRLCSFGFSSVHIMVGDGTCGWPEHAPFDAIIVTAAAPRIPHTLKEQLAEGGRMVIPAGSPYSQTLYKISRQNESFAIEEITPCVFVPLIGAYGWQGDDDSDNPGTDRALN